MKKRIASMLLALIMLFSLLPTAALAKTDDPRTRDDEDIVYFTLPNSLFTGSYQAYADYAGTYYFGSIKEAADYISNVKKTLDMSEEVIPITIEFLKDNGNTIVADGVYPQAWVEEYENPGNFTASDNKLACAFGFNAFNFKNGDKELIEKLFTALGLGEMGLFSTLDLNDVNLPDEALSDAMMAAKFTDNEQKRVGDILQEVSDYFFWDCDFEVTFDRAIGNGDVSIAGQYDLYDDSWIAVSSSLEANKPLRLLGSMNAAFPYQAILLMKLFNCGVVSGWEKTVEGATMTVELRMYETARDDNGGGGNSGLSAETGTSAVMARYTYFFGDPVAQIGDQKFVTLAAAVAAAQPNDTITLLADCSGNAIEINKSLTIDFDNHTYTVTAPAVGSSGTRNQAFHLSKGNTIVFKDGTIAIDAGNLTAGSGKISRVIQNYANLTLDNMTINDTNLAWRSDSQTAPGTLTSDTMVECDNGTVSLTNGTELTIAEANRTSRYALAIEDWPDGGYADGAQVTVDGAEITGDIRFYSDGKRSGDAFLSTLAFTENATLNGKIHDDANGVSGGKITETIADRELLKESEKDGKAVYVLAPFVAQVLDTNGTTVVKQYSDLQTAVNETTDGQTVQMLTDINLTAQSTDNKYGVLFPAGKKLTFDLNGHKLEGGTGFADNYFLIRTLADELTLKDSSVGKTGTVSFNATATSIWYGSSAISVYGGKTIVESGTYINSPTNGGAAYVFDVSNNEHAVELVINGGSFSCPYGDAVIRMTLQGWVSTQDADTSKLTINDGEFTGGAGESVIWVDVETTTNYNPKCDIVINNGTFTAAEGKAVFDIGSSTNRTTDKLTITVNNGKFKSNADYIFGYRGAFTDELISGIDVEGGFFSTNKCNNIPNKNGQVTKLQLADLVRTEGKQVVDTPDGAEKTAGYLYTIGEIPPVAKIGSETYTTLAKALAAVPANNTNPVTIELLKNIVLTSSVDINKNNVVIDGKNFTISADPDYADFDQYEVGGANRTFGKCKLMTVSGNNVTVKNVTVDVKHYRGMSCLTTTGGTNVTYENVTYKGRGSGHYYGTSSNTPNTSGTVTFRNCKFDTQGYAINMSEGNPAVVIDGCIIKGWNSFGKSLTSVTAKNSSFYGAWDGDNTTPINGLLAKFRPYCPTTITNCKFSEDYLSTDTTYCGIDSGKAKTLIKMDGCSVIKNNGTASTHQVYELIDYRESDVVNSEDAKKTIFAFDAKGDAANGYTAGTFVTATGEVKAADGYQLTEIATLDTNAKVYTVTAKAVVDETGDITVGGKEITVEGTGEEAGKPTAQEAANKITETLNNPEVTGFADAKIEEATPVNEQTTIQNVDETNFDLSMILNEVKKEAAKQFDATVTNDGEITVKLTEAGEGEKFGDTDVTKQITVDLTAAAVTQTVDQATTTTVTSMTFEVKPVATITVTNDGSEPVTVTAIIPNDAITSPITFRLPVDKNVTDDKAAVYHEDEFMGNYQIKTGTDGKYIEVSSKEFSEFKYVLFSSKSAGAQISDEKYMTLADAVAAVKTGETIKLLQNVEGGSIPVSRVVTFTIDNGGYTSSATIAAGDGYTLSRSGNTYTVTEYVAPTHTGGGTTSYTVTAESAKNGTFTVDKKNASAGSTVTITVVPDKGFTLETLTVTDKNGKEVEVKNLGNNKFSFKMPRSKVSVEATFMEDNTMLNFFVDVKATDYFYDAVLWAAENDITKGTDAVHFSPNMGTTRAQVVTFLWRAAGCPEPKGDAGKFVDVPANEYYAKAVAWAIEQVITKGTSETTFSPDVVCTRGQIVTFLARFAGVADEAAGYTHGFTDVKATDYFNNAVAWAKDNKVTEGTSATTFSPNTDCTRAQVVTFLYRWMVK